LFYLSLLVLFALTRRQWVYRPEVTESDHYAKNRVTLRMPLVWISIVVFFLYTGIEAGIGFWAFTLLTEGRGISEGTAGLWTAMYWGSFMFGRIIFGFVESGLTRLIRLSLVFAAAGVLLLAIADASVLGLAGLVLMGLSIAPIFPGLVALTPDRVGKRHAPNAIGYQIGAAGLAGAAIPGLAGVLGDAYGLNIMPWFFLVVALAIFFLHELLVYTARHTDTANAPGASTAVDKL
jgi:fucose permease